MTIWERPAPKFAGDIGALATQLASLTFKAIRARPVVLKLKRPLVAKIATIRARSGGWKRPRDLLEKVKEAVSAYEHESDET
jgi:hypothetical protein